MRKFSIGIALLLSLFLVSKSFAQSPVTPTAPVIWNTSGQGTISIQVVAISGGTLTFACSVDNTNFESYLLRKSGTTTDAATATTTGIYSGPLGPCNSFRVSISAAQTASVWQRTIVAVKTPPTDLSGVGTVTSISTTAPITGGPITTTGTIECATCLTTATGAPIDATYITQTANATLPNEQALASLSSGIMRVATTTGVVTALTDSAGIAANVSDETGSNSLVFQTSPTLTGNIDIETTGARFSAADGVITILGLGNGADESLTVDLDNAGADTIAFSTGTGATTTVWPFINQLGGTAGVSMSASDGVLTLLGLGNGSDENLTIDLDNGSANSVTFSSTTGVDFIQYSNSSGGMRGRFQASPGAYIEWNSQATDRATLVLSDNDESDLIIFRAEGATTSNININGIAGSYLQIATAGVRLSGSNGILTILGSGTGNDENATLDFDGTSNTIVIGTSTGVTKWDFGTIIVEGAFNSSDGSAGVTGATCTAWKNGLCTSL